MGISLKLLNHKPKDPGNAKQGSWIIMGISFLGFYLKNLKNHIDITGGYTLYDIA